MRFRYSAAACAALIAASAPLGAQQRTVTAADYARAERFMSYDVTPLVSGAAAVRPVWLKDERFVFQRSTSSGADMMIVDPARGGMSRLVEDPRLSAAAAGALNVSPDVVRQRTTQGSVTADGRLVNVTVAGHTTTCDMETLRCGAAVDQREIGNAGGRGGRAERGGGR